MSVPAPFRDRLGEWGTLEVDGGLPSPAGLAEVAACALARSLEPEGRERRGAFDLLAADAFLTRAAESALEEDDPRGLLARMAGWIAAGGAGAFALGLERSPFPDADTTD